MPCDPPGIPLPVGEAAVREPRRTAASHSQLAGRPVPWPAWDTVRACLRVNAPGRPGWDVSSTRLPQSSASETG
jgi:hypothetical protein